MGTSMARTDEKRSHTRNVGKVKIVRLDHYIKKQKFYGELFFRLMEVECLLQEVLDQQAC
jgi:hypothetical protein